MLSEDDINDVLERVYGFRLERWELEEGGGPVMELSRAIESAATSPLLARIAELERLRSEDHSHALDLAAEIERLTQQLEEARKDAERRLDLVERVRKYPENVDYKGSLLWADILREVDRAAIKEQT